MYIMPNAWVEHIKKYAKENNLSYGCALVIKKQKNQKQKNQNQKNQKHILCMISLLDQLNQ